MSLRTFIAVAVSPEIRRGAERLIGRLRRSAPDVRWVAGENLHWTLQFLGDVDDEKIPAVCEAVTTSVAGLEPFDVTARGAGAFPSPDRPNTIWLGAGQGSEALVDLEHAIKRPLKKLGYPGDSRRFVPHITLGRTGRRGRPASLAAALAPLADFEAGTMRVDQVTVFSSALTPTGSQYQVVAQAPLAR